MTPETLDTLATPDDPEYEALLQMREPDEHSPNIKTEITPILIAPVSDTYTGDQLVKIEEHIQENDDISPPLSSLQDNAPILSTSDAPGDVLLNKSPQQPATPPSIVPPAPAAQNPPPANVNNHPPPLVPAIQIIQQPVALPPMAIPLPEPPLQMPVAAPPLQLHAQTPVTRWRRRRRLPLKPHTVKEAQELALHKDPNYTPRFKVPSAALKDPWLPRLRINPGRWSRGHIRHFPRPELTVPTHPVFGFRMRHDDEPTICRKPPSQGFKQMAGGRYLRRITPARSGVFNYSKDTILLHHYHDERFHKKGFMQPQCIWCTTGCYYSTLVNN